MSSISSFSYKLCRIYYGTYSSSRSKTHCLMPIYGTPLLNGEPIMTTHGLLYFGNPSMQ